MRILGLEVYADSESRRKAVEIIRQARPDLILTHYPEDYMCDHSTTGRLIIDASFVASLPNYRNYFLLGIGGGAIPPGPIIPGIPFVSIGACSFASFSSASVLKGASGFSLRAV